MVRSHKLNSNLFTESLCWADEASAPTWSGVMPARAGARAYIMQLGDTRAGAPAPHLLTVRLQHFP
jgi:hypothetical protein